MTVEPTTHADLGAPTLSSSEGVGPPVASTVKPPFRKSRTALALGVGVFGLVFGLLIGGGDEAPVAQPATTTSNTPTACLTALTLADEGFGLSSKIMGLLSEGITSATQGNLVAAETATSEVTAVTAEITLLAPKYQTAKATCRAS